MSYIYSSKSENLYQIFNYFFPYIINNCSELSLVNMKLIMDLLHEEITSYLNFLLRILLINDMRINLKITLRLNSPFFDQIYII